MSAWEAREQEKKGTRKQGNKETRNEETREEGNEGTRERGNKETKELGTQEQKRVLGNRKHQNRRNPFKEHGHTRKVLLGTREHGPPPLPREALKSNSTSMEDKCVATWLPYTGYGNDSSREVKF